MICFSKKVREVLIFPIFWQIIRVQDHQLVSTRNCRQYWSWIIGISVNRDLPEDFGSVVGEGILHSHWQRGKNFLDETLFFKLVIQLQSEDFISHLSYIFKMLQQIYILKLKSHLEVSVDSSAFLASL